MSDDEKETHDETPTPQREPRPVDVIRALLDLDGQNHERARAFLQRAEETSDERFKRLTDSMLNQQERVEAIEQILENMSQAMDEIRAGQGNIAKTLRDLATDLRRAGFHPTSYSKTGENVG